MTRRETDVDVEYLLSGLDLAGAGSSRPDPAAAGASGLPLPVLTTPAPVKPALTTRSAVLPDGHAVTPGAAQALIPLRDSAAEVADLRGHRRSESNAVWAILRSHPEVLSLSEFFLCLRTMLPPGTGVISAATFWKALSAPHPVFDSLVRGGAGMPEFLSRPARNAVQRRVRWHPGRVHDGLAAPVRRSRPPLHRSGRRGPVVAGPARGRRCAPSVRRLAARTGTVVAVERRLLPSARSPGCGRTSPAPASSTCTATAPTAPSR